MPQGYGFGYCWWVDKAFLFVEQGNGINIPATLFFFLLSCASSVVVQWAEKNWSKDEKAVRKLSWLLVSPLK